MSKIFLTALLLALILSIWGCSAVNYGTGVSVLGTGETVRGMRLAMQEGAGTFIMQNQDMFLFAWPRNGNYAFSLICTGQCPAMNSILNQTVKFSQFCQLLEANGWKTITPSAIPAGIATALTSYTTEAVLAGMRTLPTVILIPVMILTPAYLPKEVLQ